MATELCSSLLLSLPCTGWHIPAAPQGCQRSLSSSRQHWFKGTLIKNKKAQPLGSFWFVHSFILHRRAQKGSFQQEHKIIVNTLNPQRGADWFFSLKQAREKDLCHKKNQRRATQIRHFKKKMNSFIIWRTIRDMTFTSIQLLKDRSTRTRIQLPPLPAPASPTPIFHSHWCTPDMDYTLWAAKYEGNPKFST